MKRSLFVTAVAAIALIGANVPAMAQTVTLTGSSLNTSTVSVQTGTSDTSASISSNNIITIGSGNNVIFNSGDATTFVPSAQDAGQVLINNGTVVGGQVVTLGNLNSLLSAGAAGNVSFNVSSFNGGAVSPGIPNGNGPYWQVLLADPSTTGKTMLINAFSNPATGANTLNLGNSTNASVSLTFTGSGVTYNNAGHPGGAFTPPLASDPFLWTSIAAVTPDGAGTAALGTWNVLAVGIADGGFVNNSITSASIDSITLPSVAAVPEPSTWAMMMLGFAGLGLLSYRRTRRNGGLKLHRARFRIA